MGNKMLEIVNENDKAQGFEAWKINDLPNLSANQKAKFIPVFLKPDMLELFVKAKKLFKINL